MYLLFKCFSYRPLVLPIVFYRPLVLPIQNLFTSIYKDRPLVLPVGCLFEIVNYFIQAASAAHGVKLDLLFIIDIGCVTDDRPLVLPVKSFPE